MTIIICSLAAAVQLATSSCPTSCTKLFICRGWDQTGSNGANLSFPQVFGIAQTPGDPNNSRNDWIVGVINAA